MNEKQLDKKVSQDAAKVKKDIGTLVEHSVARLGKLEDNVSQATGKAKEDVTAWVEDSASQLSKGFDKLSGDAKETLEDAAATVKKDVDHGMKQYNATARDLAGKVSSSDIGKTVTKYPWAAIVIGLAIGFLLGILLRPSHQNIYDHQI
jgi:ElaB/YqjD/DUF883 family membrane-anchored ribosome-binding protein